MVWQVLQRFVLEVMSSISLHARLGEDMWWRGVALLLAGKGEESFFLSLPGDDPLRDSGSGM